MFKPNFKRVSKLRTDFVYRHPKVIICFNFCWDRVKCLQIFIGSDKKLIDKNMNIILDYSFIENVFLSNSNPKHMSSSKHPKRKSCMSLFPTSMVTSPLSFKTLRLHLLWSNLSLFFLSDLIQHSKDPQNSSLEESIAL